VVATVAVLSMSSGAVASGAGARIAQQNAVLPTFACYDVQFSGSRWRSVRIQDQLGKSIYVFVKAAIGLCSAAEIDGGSTGDMSVHLVCFHTSPRWPLQRSLRFRNILGSQTSRVGRSRKLCTPAATASGGILGRPPTNLDAFGCYDATVDRAIKKGMIVKDEHGSNEDEVDLLNTICVPASAPALVGRPRPLQRRLLACYALISDVKSPTMIVRTSLALLKAAPGVRRHVCLPSAIVLS